MTRHPARDGAARLVDEGYGPSTTLVIRDCFDATPEIRTTIKGPYPKLRQLIATLLDKEPALALRELTMSRPNGDTPEVEAKIRWVVFLADGWAPAESGGKP